MRIRGRIRMAEPSSMDTGDVRYPWVIAVVISSWLSAVAILWAGRPASLWAGEHEEDESSGQVIQAGLNPCQPARLGCVGGIRAREDGSHTLRR